MQVVIRKANSKIELKAIRSIIQEEHLENHLSFQGKHTNRNRVEGFEGSI